MRKTKTNNKPSNELFIEDLGRVTGGKPKWPPVTTLAIGEEDDDPTTLALGEEDSQTTLALGEEDGGI